MRRIAIAAALVAGVVAPLGHGVARAGGAVWEFEREHYAPGDRVTGRVTFGRGSGSAIRADAGSFTAYLLPRGQAIEEPPIPPGAVPVGPMQLSRTEYGDWLAVVDFILPDLPTGMRMLEFCNDPCTVSAMGELTFGWFRVIPIGQDASANLLRERL
jgi:hypothetical protein